MCLFELLFPTGILKLSFKCLLGRRKEVKAITFRTFGIWLKLLSGGRGKGIYFFKNEFIF